MEHKDYQVDLVDDKGFVVGHKRRGDINQTRDFFHGVHVLMITPRSELVLSNLPEHQELPNQYWRRLSTTAATIRRSRESATQAARRALRRELLMNLKADHVHQLGDRVLIAPGGIRIFLSGFYVLAEPPEDVSTMYTESLKTMRVPRFRSALKSNPDHFTPTLRSYWDWWSGDLPLD
jgi:hypothetical protein